MGKKSFEFMNVMKLRRFQAMERRRGGKTRN